ncbi:MAG: GxxExxY protein [Candidatus Marinimicrobia bacterium]|nr:GxxExxY protein [Candidatus Neomarinimicrobiota bacterium]MCF7828518.1 GxxExxY protein [Candidatus Neomarinimicrobiota bacterium]MCF7882059.1 GxxExxY protein [Candidatus Neomarinimicrobiota bacterium]
MTELLYQDLTKKIRQAAYDVHSYFGAGFLEKVYENALVYELKKSGVSCISQRKIDVYYEDKIVGEYYADILVERKIIIELKTVADIQKIHLAQLKNYLKATQFKLGLLINFGSSKLQFKRVVL